ncbi:hypothetical protein AF335_27995 [Streptomyces eurocidicus]|uniref:Lipoprotein n=1 Tax=Streptomyces eurocidicus TaxID=66423 RepID=A0A2N8NPG0_STREU|nr:hypothetical protein [Streptomyces eurocidicus]MBB5119638.1 hypothetical protein [Streptomyces eurocidicus]MBF6050667.1 hypothetical protein [Streptomyces eurocidicus]PNE30647.1 hypothetical protein AF335_27995 [Streptomyces eurocidicus]
MRWHALGLVGALVVGASLTATGCANYFGCGVEGKRPAGLTREDLIGAYKADPFGRFELRADGTFTASDWPEFNYPYSAKHLGGGTGRWKLNSQGDVIGMDDDIELSFDEEDTGGATATPVSSVSARESGAHFSVAGTREKPRMYRYTGDPDICELHVLRRAKSAGG